MNKKGQIGLSALPTIILVLVFSAIVLVMGLVISQNIVDTANDVSVTVTNETQAHANTTGYTLAPAGVCNFNAPSITAVWNATDDGAGNYNLTVPTANVSVSSTGVLTNGTTIEYNNVSVSYTYSWGDQACESGNNTVYGLGAFADFWEIIVLAIVITIVIGLLLVIFGGRRSR